MISKEGDGLGIAARMQAEGHSVRIALSNPQFEFALLGILERSSNWRRDAADWADLVVGDMVGLGSRETTLAKFDVLHIGFNPMADVLELDRDRQAATLRKFGVRMPETFSFETPSQARDLKGLWTSSVRGFVLKPSGNIDTGKTLVLRNRAMLDWALDQYSGDQALVAQRFIEGVEISTEGWFNGFTWIEPFNHTMEEKRFLTDGLGPNVGCMGNVVWPIANGDRDMFVAELKKLTPFLKTIQYKGPIDLNTIANSEGIWALELTARFGYDAIEALTSLLEEPLAALLMETAMGMRSSMKLKQEFSIAIRLSVPPYPHDKPNKLDRGMPVLGLDVENPNHFLTDVMQGERAQLTWSASDGVLAKVTGTGRTIKESRRAAYKTARTIRAQGLQYRTDIGERVEVDLKQLRTWRFL